MRNIILALVAVCFSFSSCTKEEEYDIVNLNGNKITILGHAGLGVGSSPYPMNSYESIVKAIDLGADGSELDVQITNDSVLVAFHDKFLEEATDHFGEIYTKNWDEIKDAVYKNNPYQIYHLSSLDRIFSTINATQSVFTFDIKFNNPDQSAVNADIFQRALIRLIEKYHIEKNITLEAPSAEFLTSMKQKKNNLNLFMYSEFDEALQIAKTNNLKGITIKADEISADQVKEAHNQGIMVAVFSATRRNHKEIIEKNVDIIQTDDVEDLVERLK